MQGPTKQLYSRSTDWSPSLGSETPTQGVDSKQTPHDLVGPPMQDARRNPSVCSGRNDDQGLWSNSLMQC